MGDYVNDEVPSRREKENNKCVSLWDYLQVSDAQYAQFDLNRLSGYTTKFYTNINRWNLFTDEQIRAYDNMRVDDRGRYAFVLKKQTFFD
jgi:hypothetical protein